MTIKLLPINGRNSQNVDIVNPVNIPWRKIILFLVLVIIVIFIFRLLTASDPVSYRNLGLYKAEAEMQTGDLVFVSYQNLFGYFMRGITNSVWTHVGMVMKDGEDIYVLETADYSSVSSGPKTPKNFKSKGIIVVPWEDWKSLNKHHSISYMHIETPKDWNRQIFTQKFLEIQTKNLDTFSVGPSVWVKTLWKQKYVKNQIEKNNITCHELVVKVYQNADVAKKTHSSSSYNTGNLIEKKLELNENFKFNKPMRLI